MDKYANVYRRYLYRLGLILIVLYEVQFLGTLLTQNWIRAQFPKADIRSMLFTSVLAILAGAAALAFAKYEKWKKALLAFTAADFVALALLLTSASMRNIDTLIDLSLFLVGMVVYLQALDNSHDRGWKHALKAEPLALDLRITNSGDLFDPLVMAPHLEINPNISAAVDHFLETSDRFAPLQLYIHCGERISPLLLDTMEEILREHYADEEVRVNRFLESRFGRALGLILVSITALQLLHRFSGQDSSAIVWTIVSNFAGFSLWQIGSTFFERSEAKRQLLKIQIAKNAEIRFM